MNFLNLIAGVNAPNDLWNNLIKALNGSLHNLGWSILILTILVKLVTTPLDFMVKYSTKKQTLIQQKCAPQIAKLQKKFGNDQKTLQVQTNSLYKREGLNMGTGCIIMLVNLILTCTIFFSFFGSLRTTSAYETIRQYEVTAEAFDNTFKEYFIAEKQKTRPEFDENDFKETIDAYETAKNKLDDPEISDGDKLLCETIVNTHKDLVADATQAGSKEAIKVWNENKSTWLWVQNIWVADAPTNPFPYYDELKSTAKNANGYYSEYAGAIDKDEYNSLANTINSNLKSQNGYFIIAILTGVLTYVSSLIGDLHNKLKNKKANNLAKATNQQNAGTMKIMKFLMPVIMVIFVITSSASFGIYILASSLAGLVFGELISLIVDKLTKKKQIEVEEFLEIEANRLIKKGKFKE